MKPDTCPHCHRAYPVCRFCGERIDGEGYRTPDRAECHEQCYAAVLDRRVAPRFRRMLMLEAGR